MEIELIYFDGCPSWERAWTELGRALVDSGLGADVRLRHIDTLDENEKRGFAGSPTLRIDGRDFEGYDGPPVMACRRYQSNEGRGWPSAERIQVALGTSAGGNA